MLAHLCSNHYCWQGLGYLFLLYPVYPQLRKSSSMRWNWARHRRAGNRWSYISHQNQFLSVDTHRSYATLDRHLGWTHTFEDVSYLCQKCDKCWYWPTFALQPAIHLRDAWSRSSFVQTATLKIQIKITIWSYQKGYDLQSASENLWESLCGVFSTPSNFDGSVPLL